MFATRFDIGVTTEVIIAITPGELYNNWEKLYLPFDIHTWTYLFIIFGIAFGFIFVVNQMPDTVQSLFYGEGIRMPAFNVLGTFFGIGQTRLPSSNFPRMILMFFILFCLIFRTAYQSVLFEMMTSDMRKPSPKTIQDLFEQCFTIYTDNSVLYKEILMNMLDKSMR